MVSVVRNLLWHIYDENFRRFFGSVHYLLTFIFISVRYLFSNRELIKIKKRITSETETATAEGKCGSDFLMVYLP